MAKCKALTGSAVKKLTYIVPNDLSGLHCQLIGQLIKAYNYNAIIPANRN